MALSRIWSSFIVIAFLVAGIKFLIGTDKPVFNSMVVGKSGDSVELKKMARSDFDSSMLLAMDSGKVVANGRFFYKKNGDEVSKIKVQSANGIIATCKDAVDICIGLIGIMTLFMGFMNIA